MRKGFNNLLLLVHINMASSDPSALQRRRQKPCLDHKNFPDHVYWGKKAGASSSQHKCGFYWLKICWNEDCVRQKKIFHPLGKEMAMHKPPPMKRHELCHVLFCSLMIHGQHSTKHCSLHHSPLDTNLLVTTNMMWQTDVSRGSYVNFGPCVEWRFFLKKNIVWGNLLWNHNLE